MRTGRVLTLHTKSVILILQTGSIALGRTASVEVPSPSGLFIIFDVFFDGVFFQPVRIYPFYRHVGLVEIANRAFEPPVDPRYMRKFYLTFPIRDALRHKLSWTHYRMIMKVDDPKAREYYLTDWYFALLGQKRIRGQIYAFRRKHANLCVKV